MAFADEWDVTTPADTDWASEGDDSIREMKRALDERLGSIIDNWPDGDLAIKSSAIPADATDDVLAIGLKSEIPNPPATKFYWATDTKELFVDVESSWVLVPGNGAGNGNGTPTGERFEVAVADYDESLGAGAMSLGQFTGYRALAIFATVNFVAGEGHIILNELGMTETNFFIGMAQQRVGEGAWSPCNLWVRQAVVVNLTESYLRIFAHRIDDGSNYSGWMEVTVLLFVRV